MIFQIVAEGHRDILAVLEAKSARDVLIDYFVDTAKSGDRKMIRGDRLIVTTKQGIRRSYTAKKV